MADIWNRTITLGTTIAGDRVRINLGPDNLGMIAMQAQIVASRRSVSQMMDLTTGNLHIIAGIPDPCQVSLVGVVSQANTYKAFIEKFGNACGGNTLTISASPGMCTTSSGSTLAYQIDHAIIVQLQDAVSQQQQYMYIGSVVLLGIGPTLTTS